MTTTDRLHLVTVWNPLYTRDVDQQANPEQPPLHGNLTGAPHVHVDRDQGRVKIWLDPVTLAWAAGFTRHDIRRILKIVQRNRDELERSWNEYFKR